jgi:hypothetical protein
MRKSTVLLSAVAIASVAVSVWLGFELRAERARYAELVARSEQTSEAPVAAPVPAAQLVPAPQAQASTLQPPVPASPASIETASNPPRRVAPLTGDEWMARQRQLLSDPRYREAWYEQQRLAMAGRRDRIKDFLQLTDEQADAIIDLSIDRQLTWQFQTAPDPANEAEFRERRERAEEAQRAEESGLRAVLGDSKFAQYQDYIATSDSRQQVSRLQSELSGADALRDEQIEPLVAAMHVEQTRMLKEIEAYQKDGRWQGDPSSVMQKMAERQAEAQKAAHARMRSAASTILSFSQLERLDAMLKREEARQETQARMQRIQQNLEPAAGAASPR